MIIEIDQTAVDYILGKLSAEQDSRTEILALNNLATAHRAGYHVVTGSRGVMEVLRGIALLDDSSRRVYDHLWSRATFSRLYQEKFKYRVVVKDCNNRFSRLENDNKCVFVAPLTYFANLQSVETTHLVCEDLRDCTFFIELARKFVAEHHDQYNVRVSFRSMNGGGQNTSLVYSHEIQNGFFALGIADSDRTVPQDNIGNTLKSMRSVHDIHRNSAICELLELEVREKENLVSPSLYLLGANSSIKETLDELAKIEAVPELADRLKYFDMKDGLKVRALKKESVFAYYVDMIREVAGLVAVTRDTVSELDDNHTVIGGLGSNPIDDFVRNVLGSGLEHSLEKKRRLELDDPQIITELEANIEKKTTLFRHIPQYLNGYIKELCEDLLCWGCCHEPLAT